MTFAALLEFKDKISGAFWDLFLEWMLFNPLIWYKSTTEVKQRLITYTCDEIELNIKIFKIDKLINILLSSLETYITLNPKQYKSIIDTLQGIITNYLLKYIKNNQAHCILPYLNVYYVRRIKNYPILLAKVLKVLLSLFLAQRDNINNEIYENIRNKRDNHILTTVLIIMQYTLYHLEDNKKFVRTGSIIGDEIHNKDQIMLKYCKDEKRIIDEIIGMCLYIFLDIDLNTRHNDARNIALEFMSGGNKLSMFKGKKVSIIEFAAELSERHKINIEDYVLNTLFPQRRIYAPILGRVTFKALTSVIFNRPKDIAEELGITVKIASCNLNKTKFLLHFLLQQAPQRFTPEANTDIVRMLQREEKITKKIISSEDTMSLILGMSEAMESKELQGMQGFLWNYLCSECPHLWKYLAGSPLYKLNVLCDALNFTKKAIEAKDINTTLRCIDFSYALEDIYEEHFASSSIPELFLIALCKLLLYVNKAQLLYTSMPPWKVNESRTIQLLKKDSNQEREGGILRILLKLIFISCKYHEVAYSVLTFLLFRNRKSKYAIKRFLGLDCLAPTKSKKEKINLITILQEDKDTILQLQSLYVFILKKVIKESYTLLETHRVKNQSISHTVDNYFCSAHSLTLYLISSLLQLIYFELFKIDSHCKFPNTEEELSAIHNSYKLSAPPISTNYISLVKILKKVIRKLKDNKLKKATEVYLKKSKNTIFNSSFIIKHDDYYSDLDRKEITKKDIEMYSKKCDIQEFNSCWQKFCVDLIRVFKEDAEKMNKELFEVLFDVKHFFFLYSRLRFLVSYPFHQLNTYIAEKTLPRITSVDTDQRLLLKIWTKFSQIEIPKEVFENNILKENFELIASRAYKKAMKDQYTELGCWYNKQLHKDYNTLFNYIAKQYQKLLNRDFSTRKVKNKCINEFVKLSMKRDNCGRALILKKVDAKPSIWYKYLRHFVLKKFLIRKICNKTTNELYKEDFNIKLVKDMFNFKPKHFKSHKIRRKEYVPEIAKTVIGKSEVNEPFDIKDYFNIGQYIPKSMKVYEIEVITIEGSLYGRLYLNETNVFLYKLKTFKYDEKDEAWVLNKWWRTEDIKEIVCSDNIEIYFYNTAPLLFSLINEELYRSLMDNIKRVLKKNKSIKFVENRKRQLINDKMVRRWLEGKISNAKYLMFLNKYSGRSFNNPKNYPVFPLVIKDFVNTSLNLSSKETYCDFDTSRSQAYGEIEDHTFQIVFKYLIRLEPYSWFVERSNKTIGGEVFYDASKKYSKSYITIPEFYYLPELCINYNNYSFNSSPHLLSMNQVILPLWAESNHKFVHLNTLALESMEVSLRLHKWIDIIFGQVDTKYCHITSTREEGLDIKVVHEPEVSSVKLFNETHPQREQKVLEQKYKQLIFNPYEDKDELKFDISRYDTINEPIIYVNRLKDKIIIITSTQTLYTQEDLSGKKTSIQLFPFKFNTKYDTQRCFGQFNGDFIITCRHYDNSWKVVNRVNGNIEMSIQFHKAMVNSVCVSKNKAFTGCENGMVAMWLLSDYSLVWCMKSHEQKIISMDVSEQLEVIISASIDGTITIRRIYNGTLIRIIKSLLKPQVVRLSYRGYIIIITNCFTENKGCLFVYSLNGELISTKPINYISSSIVMSKEGDKFIIGGDNGNIMKYDIHTLEETDMLKNNTCPRDTPCITSMCLTLNKGPKQLLLATTSGTIYSLKTHNT